MPSQVYDAVVEKVEVLSIHVKAFHLVVEGVHHFHFEPGQYISLDLPLDEEDTHRPHSIASPPRGDNRLELCIARVPEDKSSEYMHRLVGGERLPFTGPWGSFRLRLPQDREAVFIATGTGVAPFRPMLERLLREPAGPDIWLLFGIRTEDDILYRPEFDAWAREHPRFHFIPTLSRPGDGWSGHRGHVQVHLERHFFGRTDIDYYVCGLTTMVDDVRRILTGWGVPAPQIHDEKYD